MRKIICSLVLTIAVMFTLSAPILGHASLTVHNPVTTPTTPTANDPVTVYVNVTRSHSSIQNVSIVYTTDNWKSVNRTVAASQNSTTGTWNATIPALAGGGHIQFYVVAYDTNDVRYVNNNTGTYFAYDVTSTSPLNTSTTVNWIIAVIVFGAIGAFAVSMLRSIKRPNTQSSNTRNVQ